MTNKFGCICKNNSLVVWKSPHGIFQAKQALDLSGGGKNVYDIIAPANGRIHKVYSWLGKQSFFNFKGRTGQTDFDFQFVHCKPKHRSGTYVKKGRPLGVMALKPPIHVHMAVKINGKWCNYLNYADREIKLRWGWPKPSIWGTWKAYPDLFLNQGKMIELRHAIPMTTVNTIPMNIRKRPTTASKSVGKAAPRTKLEAKILTQGTKVRGDNAWIKYRRGWIARSWCKEDQIDCASISSALVKCTDKIRGIRKIID